MSKKTDVSSKPSEVGRMRANCLDQSTLSRMKKSDSGDDDDDDGDRGDDVLNVHGKSCVRLGRTMAARRGRRRQR